MFWICSGNSDDSTESFSLLLSSIYTESSSFQLFTPPRQWRGWGCSGSWEETQTGQMTPTDHREIPYHMDLYSARGNNKKEESDVQNDDVCFPKSRLCVTECLFPGNGWTPVSHGKWWLNALFALIVCMALAFRIKLFLSQPTKSLLTFLLLFSSQSQWGEGECTAAWGCYWLELSTNTDIPIIFGRKKLQICNWEIQCIWNRTTHAEVNLFCQKLCLFLLCFLICL